MSDKSDFYKPTAHLRFVVRYEPLPPDKLRIHELEKQIRDIEGNKS